MGYCWCVGPVELIWGTALCGEIPRVYRWCLIASLKWIGREWFENHSSVQLIRAWADVGHNVFTCNTDVGEDPNGDAVTFYYEAMGFRCIMPFWKGVNIKSSDMHRSTCRKRIHKRRLEKEPAVVMGSSGNINGDPDFRRSPLHRGYDRYVHGR